MSDTSKQPRLLTVREVADTLRVHRRTAYRLITRGDIKAIKIGTQWRVLEEALLDFIASGWKDAAHRPKPEKGPRQLRLPLDEE
ncbi:DNA binding domain-containing protein, excisionase family [Paucidesulfovibrio gracilis DSM 16080]|uniref:DNA binding domain-containing protein, excisionase family n=1 Tax=Paucidesulfovibrio gracilis DSM 16080 TaxID=1121449 RepID=A0A1T4XPC7_9BACT|nr:helix-turn-helix domain-containing protein [Paucidesulfovibrio gracilis]SKA90968.1 DNA binding domain-containing protein, excisionase family [Paucidesulfovibrio gracilis DSM 16080]